MLHVIIINGKGNAKTPGAFVYSCSDTLRASGGRGLNRYLEAPFRRGIYTIVGAAGTFFGGSVFFFTGLFFTIHKGFLNIGLTKKNEIVLRSGGNKMKITCVSTNYKMNNI